MSSVRVGCVLVLILAIFSKTDSAEDPLVGQTQSDNPSQSESDPPPHTTRDSTEAEASTSRQLPAQTTCDGVKAEERSVTAAIVEDQGNWMLRRVTPMSDYHTRFGRNRNVCSVFHYGPDCRSINFLRMESVTYTTSFNESTKSLLIITTTPRSLDPHYAVDQEIISKMEEYEIRNESSVSVDPEQFKKELESEYALIALAPHRSWSILQTCDKKIIWVKVLVPYDYPKNVATHKIISDYDVEIETRLKELEIPSETLAFVPLFVAREYLLNE